jgi:serine/threonine protein kinase
MPFPVLLNAGDNVDKYELLQRLGAGGFGDVWLARDMALDAEVALKILDATSAQLAAILQEAQIGNLAAHQNLVQIRGADARIVAGHRAVLIAMEYHRCGSAISMANAGGYVPLNRAIPVICDILRGLEFLPEIGVLHNDIKPQNILIGDDGRGILTDYGISARAPGGAPVQPPNAYIPHVSPETLQRGEIDLRTEVYQAGLTACRLISGLGLVEARRAALGDPDFAQAVIDGEVIRPADFLPFVPTRLRRVLRKAIHNDPARRYQSPREFRNALEGMHFPGSWTVDGNGNSVGCGETRDYRFDIAGKAAGKSDFTAYKTVKASGRETRAAAFCGKNLTLREIRTARERFMQAVVEGNV